MKLQARSTTARRTPLRRRGKDQKSWKFKFCTLLYLLVVVSVFFGVANYRIDLNRKISDLQRLHNRTKQDIHELERDIQALKVARDRLSSWNNVRSKIAYYKMPFRAAESQQVRFFAVKPHRSRAVEGSAQDNSLAMLKY